MLCIFAPPPEAWYHSAIMKSVRSLEFNGGGSPPRPARSARERGLRERFGLPEARYRDEAGMPPVDEDLIRLLVGRKLRDDAAATIFESIENYSSWADAYTRILIEVARGPGGLEP